MIDLCIALSGPHVGLMLPFFVDSLNATSDLSEVTLHFVDKGCSIGVKNYLRSISSERVIVHEMIGTYRGHNATFSEDPSNNLLADCAGTCRWMLDHCGNAPWCFISHFDIEFLKDLLGRYTEQCLQPIEGLGQTGCHMTGLVGYRRDAVKQCGVDFSDISGFCVVKDDRDVWVLRHRSDARCTDCDIPIHGWDIGELLELNLAFKGWGIYSPTMEELNGWRYHLGTGSGHCGDLAAKREEALAILKRRGLGAIE